MARWPTNPEWVDPNNGINQGNQYNSADGVTVTDFNNLIKDIIYLRNKAAPVIQPTKTVSITENGTVSVTPDTGYDALAGVSVQVNVPTHEPVLQEKTVTSNGVVTPDAGYDGLSKVTVNVLAELPTLYAPTTSVNQDILTVTPNPANGQFNTGVVYTLYDTTTEEAFSLTSSLVVNLKELLTDLPGDHVLYVRASRNNFNSVNTSNFTYTYPEKWSTPTIQLLGSIVTTPVVSGVTKHKVYVDGTYVGYVDADGVWHSAT